MRLANRRFVPFYFDLSSRGVAADPLARKAVVAAKNELGGRGVPTPPVLFMNAKGEVLGEVSNYATADQVLTAMLKVLKDHPQYNAPAASEKQLTSPIERARLLIDLQEHEQAKKALAGDQSDQAAYLLGRLARWDRDWASMDKHFSRVHDKTLADDVRLERAYRYWHEGEWNKLHQHLKEFPKSSNRYTEARYYEGLVHYHQGKTDEAVAVWKATITGCPQDPWIYRADWAFTAIKQRGRRGFFSSVGPKTSLLKRIGYMGRGNPDLKKRD